MEKVISNYSRIIILKILRYQMKIHIQAVLDLLRFALTTKKYIYFSNILAELCDAVANLFRKK